MRRGRSARCAAFRWIRRCPACPNSRRSSTVTASFRPRSRSSSSPWLNTAPTPMDRKRPIVARAHWSGSAPRTGPGRIDSAAPAKNVPGMAARNSMVGSPTRPTPRAPLSPIRSAMFSARACTSCQGWCDQAPDSVSSTCSEVVAVVIAADSAAASSFTSSTVRQAPWREWPLPARRPCRSSAGPLR